MAHVASVILLLAVSEARLQQIMEANKEDAVFRQITTYRFKKWPDKHSLIKKDTMHKKPTGSTSGTLLHRNRTIKDRHSHIHVIRNPRKDP